MVATRPLISKSSSPIINPCVTVPTDRTNYNWYHRHFLLPWFFQFSSKVYVLIFLFDFFQFYLAISRNGKIYNSAGSLFFSFFFFSLAITRSVRLAEIKWSVYTSKLSLLLLLLSLFVCFSYHFWLMIFHWSLSDSKSPQVTRTLQSILVNLNNAVEWKVSNISLISRFFSLFSKTLRTVPIAPTTIGITVTLMFHRVLLL